MSAETFLQKQTCQGHPFETNHTKANTVFPRKQMQEHCTGLRAEILKTCMEGTMSDTRMKQFPAPASARVLSTRQSRLFTRSVRRHASSTSHLTPQVPSLPAEHPTPPRSADAPVKSTDDHVDSKSDPPEAHLGAEVDVDVCQVLGVHSKKDGSPTLVSLDDDALKNGRLRSLVAMLGERSRSCRVLETSAAGAFPLAGKRSYVLVAKKTVLGFLQVGLKRCLVSSPGGDVEIMALCVFDFHVCQDACFLTSGCLFPSLSFDISLEFLRFSVLLSVPCPTLSIWRLVICPQPHSVFIVAEDRLVTHFLFVRWCFSETLHASCAEFQSIHVGSCQEDIRHAAQIPFFLKVQEHVALVQSLCGLQI